MRKLLAALFVVAALAAASGALPGVIENVAYASPTGVVDC